MEDWKTIPEFPELAFSNFGRIYNLETQRFKKTRVATDRNVVVFSYYLVNKKRTIPIPLCKIIAKLFVKNPYNKKHVIYKDGDFTNLKSSNLAWSGSINQFKKRINSDKRSGRVGYKIRCVETGEIFNSVSDLAKFLDISKMSIYNSIKNKKKILTLDMSFERC